MVLTLVHPANGRVGPYSQIVFTSDQTFASPINVTVDVIDDATGSAICTSDCTFPFGYTAGVQFQIPAGMGIQISGTGDTRTFDTPFEIREDGRACSIRVTISHAGAGPVDAHTFSGQAWDRVGNLLAIAEALNTRIIDAGGGGGSVLAAVQQNYINSP